MLPNHSRSPAHRAGEREALDDGRAARPAAPARRRRAWRPWCRRRRRAPRRRAPRPRASPGTRRARSAAGRPCPAPAAACEAAPARAGRRPADPTARATSRASSSAGWQPRWIVRHQSPGTQHTASLSPAPSSVAIAAPAGPASARRRPLFRCRTSSRPAALVGQRGGRPLESQPAAAALAALVDRQRRGTAAARARRPGEVRQARQALPAERLLRRGAEGAPRREQDVEQGPHDARLARALSPVAADPSRVRQERSTGPVTGIARSTRPARSAASSATSGLISIGVRRAPVRRRAAPTPPAASSQPA